MRAQRHDHCLPKCHVALSVLLLCVAAIAQAKTSTGATAVAVRFENNTLQVEFAESMQTWANPDHSDVVTATPTLGLHCTWSSDTLLACQTDAQHRPASATRYHISIVGGLKTQSGKSLGVQSLAVETERPTVSADVRSWHAGVPEIIVSSNEPADAVAIASVLRVRIDGKPFPMPALHLEAPRGSWDKEQRYVLAVHPPEGEHDLELAVVPGLVEHAGPLRGRQHQSLVRARVHEPFRLRRVVCATRKGTETGIPMDGIVSIHCSPSEIMQLQLSQPLDEGSAKGLAGLLPSGMVLVRVHQSERWESPQEPVAGAPSYLIDLRVNAAQSDFVLPLGAGWRNQLGQRFRPVTMRIHTDDARPGLQAVHENVLIADPHMTKDLVMATNAEATLVSVDSVGILGRHEQLQIAAPLHRNASVSVPSATANQSLAEGGWVRWTADPKLALTDGYSPWTQPVEFAAPHFDLLAVSSRRSVLAWANDWEGQAKPSTRIQLLWLTAADAQPRVLAEGRTDINGLATLVLPPDLTLPELDTDRGSAYPMWLLRAVDDHSAQRAVLPMGMSNAYGLDLGRPSRTKLWGVTDRPLYHAGDTVHYHLWLRERRAARLMHPSHIAPVTLKLRDQIESKTIRQWSGTPSVDGAVNGDLVLPIHLTDDTYCIAMDATSSDEEGACFFVGTYRAQDLWAQATTADAVLRDGDLFTVDLAAGYYSGGPAAGVPLSDISTMLTPLPLSSAYPKFADYTFIDVDSDEARHGIEVVGTRKLQLVADSNGNARVALPVKFPASTEDRKVTLPAFGRLQLVATAKLSDREGTASNAAQARYTRFSRFVGLRLGSGWLDAITPVSLQGLVIDANGQPVAGAPIEVDVDYLPGSEGADHEATPQHLTHCHLVAGALSACNFPRAHSGRYRMTARSDDAAASQLLQYVWVNDAVVADGKQLTELTVEQAPMKVGDPVRVLLKQPAANARVLLVIGSGDTIWSSRVETMAGSAKDFALTLDPAWGKKFTITAYVRDMRVSPIIAGLRTPAAVTSDSVDVALPDPTSDAPPLVVRFDQTTAKPGDTVQVTVRNTTASSRAVVVAVMDDALRALAGDVLSYSDPHGRNWLGGRSDYGDGRFSLASFSGWNQGEWRLALPWPEVSDEMHGVTASRTRRVDAEQAVPMSALPPPPAPSPVTGSGNLDRIEVTGSRISLADVFSAGAAPMKGVRLHPALQGQGQSDAAQLTAALARVRMQFADTVLWQPDITLAPGQTRTLSVTLPDNLTRWRAVAWSSDADDGFDMTQATLEVGLPVEVRLQAPARIYPGDRARLAANVHQLGVTEANAKTELQVQGGDGPSMHVQSVGLTAGGQGSFALDVAPHTIGTLRATASASTPSGSDAVAASVEVASPLIAARKVQAGWLGKQTLDLAIPALPAGARDAVVHVELLRGNAGLIMRWTQDLRDYPHRCWEQILSRAVAAALAIARGDTQWTDAPAVVQEALDNAAVFQSEDGDFRYFAEFPVYDDLRPDPKPEVALTAYSVRALALLRALGHPVATEVDERAKAFLKKQSRITNDSDAINAAFAASASDGLSAVNGNDLLREWDKLPLSAQLAATVGLAQSGHAGAHTAMTRLLAQAPLRGNARVMRRTLGSDRWMGSALQEQCALIGLLGRFPALAPTSARLELLAGLGDLYAGGITAVDTQTGATCLMALQDDAANDNAFLSAMVHMGDQSTRLQLLSGARQASWEAPVTRQTNLQITPAENAAPVSYVAQLNYQEDARQARASAVGFSVQRRYDVLRGGQWSPLADGVVREGQWVRITLAIDNAATRYFVALTDAVPGGLRPTDLTLSGIAGLDLKQVSDTGSWWFGTRSLDARQPHFYAQSLPAGHHEVHYFAVAGNAGNYLAAPAHLQLMYGDASDARTASERVRITPAE